MDLYSNQRRARRIARALKAWSPSTPAAAPTRCDCRAPDRIAETPDDAARCAYDGGLIIAPATFERPAHRDDR